MSRPCEICTAPRTHVVYGRHLCLQCAAYQVRIEQQRREVPTRDWVASAILWGLVCLVLLGFIAAVVGAVR